MKIRILTLVALSAFLMVPSCGKKDEPQQDPDNNNGSGDKKEVLATKISLFPERISVESGETANISVDVDADGKWTISKSPDWVTSSVTEGDGRGSISITVAANTVEEERRGTVVFSGAEGVTADLPVVQSAFEPKVVLTATLDASANDIFKKKWSDGDEIVVFCEVNREPKEETIKATEISADGLTATFVSDGTLHSKATAYYAYIPGTGVAGFNNSKNWASANMDHFEGSVPSFCVAKNEGAETPLVFQNVYSVVSFKSVSSKAAKAVFSGNGSEVINKNMLVTFSSLAVNGASAPQFTSTKTIEVDLSGQGTYYVGLYPGLNFRSGYTIHIYDASQREIELIENKASFETKKGEVYVAPEPESLVPETLSNVFDESHIAVTFGVVSDVHINNGAQDKGTTGIGEMDKWRNALRQIGAKASVLDKNGVDAVLVAGDLIDQPSADQLYNFKNVYEGVYSPTAVPMIYTIGNHDVPSYAWKSDMVAQSKYIRDYLGSQYYQKDVEPEMGTSEECRHCVISGYHILCIAPNGDQPITYSSTAVSWLEKKLAEITAADPNRYVIVLTHPMIYNTVYGSLLGEENSGIWYSSLPGYWATKVLTSIFEKYPQVVVFGGHLHFPLNDPRSAWQDKFTVFGCGSVRYMALENGGYEGMASATTMSDRGDFSQGHVLQFDYNGNMRVYRMDFLHSAVIGGEPISMQYPTADGANLKVVNHADRALKNQKPSMNNVTAEVKEKSATVTWASGTDDEFVHHYVVTLKKNGSAVSTKKYLSDFYKSALTSGMKNQWSTSYTSLEDGKYEVSIVAVDSWEAESEPAVRSFTVGAASNADIWVNDDQGGMDVEAGAGSISNDWLSYSNGRVSWTANTTGAVRSGSLSMPDGGTFKVTQISEKDFMGSWTLRSKLFDPNKTVGKGTVAADETSVTFGSPLNAASLTDASGSTHKNNIGISGLYPGATMDAALEVDYGAKTVRLGLFCDRRAAQAAGSGYCVFLPECAGVQTWGSYNFAPSDFSSTDYDWIWFTISSDYKKAQYVYYNKAQKTSNGKYYICGVSVVKATSASASSIAGSYDVIYQANYNSSNSDGMYFIR